VDRASSYNFFKPNVASWIYKNFKKDSEILDVGAGSGTYYNLLGKWYKNIDAVEIYESNIYYYNLLEKYRRCFNVDIINFEYSFYDLIIFGDVIEHMTVQDAQKVIDYAYDRCKNLIVAVPYLLSSGAGNQNVHEIHIQNDLTKDVVADRYPKLKLLYGNNLYGYYIKCDEQ